MTVSNLLEHLVTSLIMPPSLLQVVNSLFQTCYKNWEQAVRTQHVDKISIFNKVYISFYNLFLSICSTIQFNMRSVHLPCRRPKARIPPVLVPAIQSKSFTSGCLAIRSRFRSTCMRMRPRIPPPSGNIHVYIITTVKQAICPHPYLYPHPITLT